VTADTKPYGWIGVDLDGTLAHYDKWRGANHIGAPIPEMVERIKAWIARGQEVRIFTARVGGTNTYPQRTLVQDWLEAAGLPRLPVTATKDYQMVELWDDRAVSVVPNSGKSEREVWVTPNHVDQLGSDTFEQVAPGVYNPTRLAGKP